MHKRIGSAEFTTIRPLDVVSYLVGNKCVRGVVLATEPIIGVGRVLVNDAGSIHRIAPPEAVSDLALLSLEEHIPVQTIIDALARQRNEAIYDQEHAQKTIYAALAHSAIDVQIFMNQRLVR